MLASEQFKSEVVTVTFILGLTDHVQLPGNPEEASVKRLTLFIQTGEGGVKAATGKLEKELHKLAEAAVKPVLSGHWVGGMHPCKLVIRKHPHSCVITVIHKCHK